MLAFIFVIVSFFVLAWFVRAWCHEFVFLMGLRDSDLPGRHDKLIWAFLLFSFRARHRLVVPLVSPGSLAGAGARVPFARSSRKLSGTAATQPA